MLLVLCMYLLYILGKLLQDNSLLSWCCQIKVVRCLACITQHRPWPGKLE
jgi:hypothetical protein